MPAGNVNVFTLKMGVLLLLIYIFRKMKLEKLPGKRQADILYFVRKLNIAKIQETRILAQKSSHLAFGRTKQTERALLPIIKTKALNLIWFGGMETRQRYIHTPLMAVTALALLINTIVPL